MDNPVDPMMVTAVLVLGTPIDSEQLKATVETRLLRIDRFRQRVVRSRLPWRTPYWKDDPGLDLDYHVQRVTLPPPGDQAALQRIVGELAGTPLDMARPPWQVHLVETYGPGCALICRTHHSLADGVAMIHVLLSLADTAAAEFPVRCGAGARTTRPRCDPALAGQDRTPACEKVDAQGVADPRPSPARPRAGAQLGRDAAAAVGDIVLSPPDADTALRGVPSLAKRIAWSGPVPLEEIKTIGRRLGGTVNDVLLTALAGALRRYQQVRQDDLPADVTSSCAHARQPAPGGRRGGTGQSNQRQCSSLYP